MGKKEILYDEYGDGDDLSFIQVFDDLSFRIEVPEDNPQATFDDLGNQYAIFGNFDSQGDSQFARTQESDMKGWMNSVGKKAVKIAFDNANNSLECNALGGNWDSKSKSCSMK